MRKNILNTFILLGMISITITSCVSLRNYKEYYRNTEALIDSIAEQQSTYFLDVLMEQDVYEFYYQAKKKVD